MTRICCLIATTGYHVDIRDPVLKIMTQGLKRLSNLFGIVHLGMTGLAHSLGALDFKAHAVHHDCPLPQRCFTSVHGFPVFQSLFPPLAHLNFRVLLRSKQSRYYWPIPQMWRLRLAEKTCSGWLVFS